VVGLAGKVRRYTGSWNDVDASACWTGLPIPEFESVWSSSTTDVFVVGSGGLVCHFDGAAWSRQKAGVTGRLYGVWGRAANDVFAVGDAGTVLHYDGAQWWRLVSETTALLLGIDGSGSSVVFAGTFGAARRYAGAAFSIETPSAGPYLVASGGPGLEYATTYQNVYRHVDSSWVSTGHVANDEFSSLWVDSGGDAFVGDEDMSLHHFNGTSWVTNVSLGFIAADLEGRNGNEVYAVGASKVALVKDGAATLMGPTTTGSLQGIAVTPAHLYVAGSDGSGAGAIWTYVAATGWSTMPTPVTGALFDIYAASDSDVFAVGAAGTILHYDGVAWTAMTSGFIGDLQKVTGTSKSDVFALSPTGLVLHYDGVAWAPMRVSGDVPSSVAARPGMILLGGKSQTITAIVRDASW
jgi:hypothetical protein